MSLRISRRALLLGGGGVALGLPWLEAMESRAEAQAAVTAPRRYVVMFAGTSTGRDGKDLLRPVGLGAMYTSNTALAPLETRGVRADVGIVSNLLIPVGGPAGRPAAWHSSSPGPLLSGVSAVNASPAPRGATSEQIVAARLLEGIAAAARPRVDAVTWRIQAQGYRGGEGPNGLMSARKKVGGAVELLAPVASPQVIFKSLFAGAVSTGMGTAADLKAALAQARHRSVLDLVGSRATDLMARVGTTDRMRLQRHLDEIRDLERSVGTIGPTSVAACHNPADPGPDTAPNVVIETGGTGRTVGYADEIRRADVLTEMLYLALVCDMTRAASLMITYAQCFLNASPLLGGLPKGAQLDVHECGHTGQLGNPTMQELMSKCLAWHIDVFARVVRRLKDTPDGDGTLLDHTALALMFEGGVGADPETGDTGVTHSSENMCALYAGAGMHGGQHIEGARAHPGRVLVSAMRAVKVNDALGDLTDPLPGIV